MLRWGAWLGLALVLATPATARAEGKGVVVDRVVARWQTPELGGASNAQFVLERQLGFEARLEALAGKAPPNAEPDERHIRAALDRIVAETLLAQLPVRPPPAAAEVARRAEAARLLLEDRVGGRDRLVIAATTEGISAEELDALLRRTARASLYLDRMVAPMFDPSEAELRELHASGRTPYGDKPYREVAELVRRWLIARRVEEALDSFYQRARSRISIAMWLRPTTK